MIIKAHKQLKKTENKFFIIGGNNSVSVDGAVTVEDFATPNPVEEEHFQLYPGVS